MRAVEMSWDDLFFGRPAAQGNGDAGERLGFAGHQEAFLGGS
jgi:hypothetical protein